MATKRFRDVESVFADLTASTAPASLARSWASVAKSGKRAPDHRSFVLNSQEYRAFLAERFGGAWGGLAFVPCPRDLTDRFISHLGATKYSDEHARTYVLGSSHFADFVTDLVRVIWCFDAPRSGGINVQGCLEELERREWRLEELPDVVSSVARVPNRVAKLKAMFQRLRGRAPTLKEIRDVAEAASNDDALLQACVFAHCGGKGLFQVDLRDSVYRAYMNVYGRPVSLEEFEAVYGRMLDGAPGNVEDRVRKSHAVYRVAFNGAVRIHQRFMRSALSETEFLAEYYATLAEYLFDDREPKEPAGEFLEIILDGALRTREYAATVTEVASSAPREDVEYIVQMARDARAASDSPELRQIMASVASERKEFEAAVRGAYDALVRREPDAPEMEAGVARCRVVGADDACDEIRETLMSSFEYKAVVLDRVRAAARDPTAARKVFAIVETLAALPTAPTDDDIARMLAEE